MKQSGLTLILPVKSAAEADWLKTNLTAMGQQLGKTPQIDFRKSELTHFARFVILPGPDLKPGTERLFFSSNFDGSLTDYADHLIATGLAAAMEDYLVRCESYPAGASAHPDQFRRFLNRNNIRIQAFYVALIDITLKDIKESAAIRDDLDKSLYARQLRMAGKKDPAVPDPPPQTVKQGPDPTQAPKPVRPGIAGTLSDALGRLLQWMIGLRHRDNNPQISLSTNSQLYAIEDIVTQNQLSVVVPVKRSAYSLFMLRFVLFIMNFKFKFSKGLLSDLDTVHFARWVIIDHGKNILFESNFDGSWENYIDDFADHAVTGMNLVWGNCIGFPLSGSSDVESFKKYIRDNQSPAQVFYSAYPDSTVRNILTDISLNTKITRLSRPAGRQNFVKGYYGD